MSLTTTALRGSCNGVRDRRSMPRCVAVRSAGNYDGFLNDDPRNPDLEAAIARDPADREAYVVLADWLEGHGDVRAALIRAQIADPGTYGHGKAVRKLLTDHRDYLLGALGKMDTTVAWRYGYVSSLAIARRASAEHVARVLGHPSARFVESVGVVSDVLSPRLEAIAAGAPRTLRQLTLTNDADTDQALEPLAALLPRLTTLSLIGRFDVGALRDAVALRVLTLHHDGRTTIPLELALPVLTGLIVRGRFAPSRLELPELVNANLAMPRADDIAAMHWPKLRTLTLRFLDGARPQRLGELFARDLPLGRLELHDAPVGDAVCELLVAAPFASRLRTIVLSGLGMTDAGATLLAQRRDVFAALEELDVRDNALTQVGYTALAEMRLEELSDDSRYDELGE